MTDETKGILLSLGVRAVLAAVVAGLGVVLLRSVSDWGDLLIILAGTSLCVLLPGFLLAPPIAHLIGIAVGSFYFTGGTNSNGVPSYSVAESKRIRGCFEESIREYGMVARQYPQDLKSYLRMIDIALDDLHDTDRAQAIAHDALSVLNDPPHRARIRERMREP